MVPRLALAVVVVAVTACREDGSDPETAMSAEYARVVCEVLFNEDCPCPATTWSLQAACEQDLHEIIRSFQVEAISADVIFDEPCLDQHWTAIETLGCEPSTASADAVERCLVYHGDKQQDDACSSYGPHMSDCEQGLTCSFFGDICRPPGAPPPQLAEGAACWDSSGFPLGVCASGFECDYASTRVCVTPAALGESCPADYPCLDSWCSEGTCVERLPTGSACGSALECETFNCLDDICVDAAETPASCLAGAL